MNKAELLTAEMFSRWDEFVEKHPNGSIYHTSGWKEVLEKNFKHIKGKILAIWNDRYDEIIAGIPIYAVRSFLTGKRLVSIPFALHGTPLISTTEEKKLLQKEIFNIFNSERFSFIEIRSFLPIDSIMDMKFGLSEFYKCHYLFLSDNPEQLKNAFHKKAVQVPIRKSSENQLKLKIGQCEKDLRNYFQICYKSRKRLGLPLPPYGFYKSLWEVFSPKDQITILLAMYEGKVVGSAILLKFKDTVTVEFGYDLVDFRKLYVNQFLDWESIKIAWGEGYKKFCFGRTSLKNEGVLTYKERWGTQSIYLPKYYFPECENIRDEANEASFKYNLARKIFNSSPNFFYSKLSELVYKHLG